MSSAVSLQRLTLSHGAAPVVDLVVIFAGVGIKEATRFGKMALSYHIGATMMDSLDFEPCNLNEVLAFESLTKKLVAWIR